MSLLGHSGFLCVWCPVKSKTASEEECASVRVDEQVHCLLWRGGMCRHGTSSLSSNGFLQYTIKGRSRVLGHCRN